MPITLGRAGSRQQALAATWVPQQCLTSQVSLVFCCPQVPPPLPGRAVGNCVGQHRVSPPCPTRTPWGALHRGAGRKSRFWRAAPVAVEKDTGPLTLEQPLQRAGEGKGVLCSGKERASPHWLLLCPCPATGHKCLVYLQVRL